MSEALETVAPDETVPTPPAVEQTPVAEAAPAANTPAPAKPKSGVRAVVQEAGAAWKARFDGAYTMKEVELGAHPVRQMAKRTYDQIGRCSHFVSFFGRILLGAEHVVEAETALNNMINTAQKELEKQIEQMRTVLGNEGIEEIATFSKQEMLPMMVVMPAQNRYLKLLVTADMYMRLINTLWLEGFMNDKEKGKAEMRFKHHARSISSFARRMRVGLLRKLKDRHERGEATTVDAAELAASVAESAAATEAEAAEGADGAEARPARARKNAKAAAEPGDAAPDGALVAAA